ncbi:hypothetical protein FGO68_gene3630 [Halteria grandinella]|uniref:Uncharacterized protein n=1 Tax=Halteria grandinella TaxID=5974 RepID=A0A8J8NMG1_HALGN|nr:hypothetical protein FGO68_gene3630 [Halteria grandinella]
MEVNLDNGMNLRAFVENRAQAIIDQDQIIFAHWNQKDLKNSPFGALYGILFLGFIYGFYCMYGSTAFVSFGSKFICYLYSLLLSLILFLAGLCLVYKSNVRVILGGRGGLTLLIMISVSILFAFLIYQIVIDVISGTGYIIDIANIGAYAVIGFIVSFVKAKFNPKY